MKKYINYAIIVDMVAVHPKHHKAIKQAVSGNRISVHADDAVNMDQMYSNVASEINAARRTPVNRIAQNLSPVAEEAAVMQQRTQGAQIVDEAAAQQVMRDAERSQSLDNALGVTSEAVNYIGLAPIAVGAAQFGTKIVGRGVGKLGEVANIGALATVGEKVGRVTEQSWNNFTFNDVGDLTRTRGVLGGAAQKTMDIVSTPVDWVSRKTGFSGWRQGANTVKATTSLDAAKALTDKLTLDERTALGALTGKLNGATSAGHIATDEVKSIITGIRESEAAGALTKNGTKLLDTVEKSIAHHEGAAMWGNVKGAIRNAPAQVGKGSITHGMMNAAFIGGSVLSMFGDARGFSQNLESLRQMYADVTGEDVKKVSTLKLLTGSMPEPVASARSHMIKQFGIKQMFDIGNIALNVAMIVNHKFGSGWKGFAAFGAASLASQGVDMVMGESILPVHKAFSDAYKTGQEIPAEFYASYLFAASKDLSSRGEKGQEFAMQVGQEYAAEHASPAQVLQELQNGKMLERIKKISTQADKAQVAAPQMVQEQTTSYTVPSRGERPVVGKFTEKLNQEAQMASMGNSIA